MNIKKILAAVLTISALSVMQITAVSAAPGMTISVQEVKIKSGETKAEATLSASGSDTVTNGKIRIKYDPQKITLKSAEVGEALKETMTQVNEPLTGNKPEGEIVLVFASAEPVSLKGAMLDMEFQTGSGFDETSGAEIEVAVEELGRDGADLECTAVNGSIIVEHADAGEEDNSKTDNTQEKSQEKTVTAKSVKTGDDTKIWIPLAGAGFSLVLYGILKAVKSAPKGK
ncbi:MAG TPA: hypothetical protein IAC62_16835 [Candidatus Pelethocola excrementipullorum]|nr:hypothetical protein [Candidatus Pelethocola excrementipullorum]